jgi:hypothetical protein
VEQAEVANFVLNWLVEDRFFRAERHVSKKFLLNVRSVVTCVHRWGKSALELLLGIAVVSLVLQLLPWGQWQSAIALLDVRTWTSRVWFGANAVLFASMTLLRFGPALGAATRTALTHWNPRLGSQGEVHEHNHAPTETEERALYHRMNEARKRQVV